MGLFDLRKRRIKREKEKEQLKRDSLFEEKFNLNDVSKDKFRPENNVMEMVYGPFPAETTRECSECDNEWKKKFFDESLDVCSDCGSEAKKSDENEEIDKFQKLLELLGTKKEDKNE